MSNGNYEKKIMSIIEEDDADLLKKHIRVPVNESESFLFLDNRKIQFHFHAAKYNAFECFIYFIEICKFDFDKADEFNIKPIHVAARYGSTEIISYLLSKYQSTGKLKALFEEEYKTSADSEKKILYAASFSGISDTFKLFSLYGFEYNRFQKANKNAITQICKKLLICGDSVVKALIYFINCIGEVDKNSDNSPLIIGIINRLDIDTIKLLMKYSDINYYTSEGKNAFTSACYTVQPEITRILIRKIKYINPPKGTTTTAAAPYYSSFQSICMLKDPETTKIAFERFNKELRDSFFTPSPQQSYPIGEILSDLKFNKVIIDFIDILLENGYPLESPQDNTSIPSLLMVFLNSPFPNADVFEYLLLKGANPNVRLNFANKNQTITEYLRNTYNLQFHNLYLKYKDTLLKEKPDSD